MARFVLATDTVLDDNRFLRLCYGDEDFNAEERHSQRMVERLNFSVEDAVKRLGDDSFLAARLLFSRNGSIYWTGDYSADFVAERTLGVRIVRKRTGEEVYGDNVFGSFLEKVRDAYRKQLAEEAYQETPVPKDQIIVDYTRKGSFRSDIEERESRGERFIHVDNYRPVKFRFDMALDGTTGHAQRASDNDVPFQKWECPFGTSYPSPIIVESAAEASYLYERALRGELDWKALLVNLSERGLLNKNLTSRQMDQLASDYRAQFAWMREQICSDRSLRDYQIVSPSLLVSDASLGRSVYDPETAPSPADILARYIYNPVLLFTPVENMTILALQEERKGEMEAFNVVETLEGGINIIVVGSDTIGGREPGRKAVGKKVRESHVDESGMEIITSKKQFEIPMKSKDVVEADYQKFSSRMDSILSMIPEGTPVRLISGGSSTMGSSVGVGTPRMLSRYVTEHGGRVSNWDFAGGKAKESKAADGESALEVVLMEHFVDVLPVLSGEDKSATFLLNPNDPESEVTFRSSREMTGSGAVCFSVSDDVNNRNVLSMGSYLSGRGLPVIHVQENSTEEEQRAALVSGALLSRSALSGEVMEKGVLFSGERKNNWNLDECNMLSYIDAETGVGTPFVSNLYPVPVQVAGYPFKSALGAYVALAAVEVGLAGRKAMNEIALCEGNTTRLLAYYQDNILSSGRLSSEREEALLRQSVRLMASSNSAFSDMLFDIDGRDIVMPLGAKDASGLFVSPDGEGLNHFGMVLASERAQMVSLVEAMRQKEDQERVKALAEANRRQKLVVGARAEGQKVLTGLPRSIEEAAGAVWFLGTHTPDQLCLPDGTHSFEMWDDMDGDDPLVREKAARPWVEDGEGGRIANDYIYLFPSDLSAVTGKRRVSQMPDVRDLTNVTRKDEKTGKEYVCAYGIPVKMNNRFNEFFNKEGFPCSYRLDNDASNYAESLVLSDSNARSQAVRHGLSLCMPGRTRQDGSHFYTLGTVFMEKMWNKKEQKMVLNPHRSYLNKNLTDRYVSLLENGKDFPLNCIPLPSRFYRNEDIPGSKQEAMASGVPFISAEGRFISDLLLSLRIANSTAIALGVPLRFPMTKDGHYDLGPDIPDEFRELAERRIDSFIGVVREEETLGGELPVIEKIPLWEVTDPAAGLVKTGEDLYMKPNDLVYAFGPYDFSLILSGQVASLHDMGFRMEDGTLFRLTDAKSTKGADPETVAKFVSYESNGERRFVVRTTDPEKVPAFLSAIRAYTKRAMAIQVEARLMKDSEKAVANESLSGFVNVLSSNSDEFVGAEQMIRKDLPSVKIGGHELTSVEGVYTALVAAHFGRSTFDEIAKIARIEQDPGLRYDSARAQKMSELRVEWSGGVEIDADEEKKLRFRAENAFIKYVREEGREIGREMNVFNLSNRFDEFDAEKVYWGKVDANDGFRGYAQIRYLLPDGTQSDWKTVKNKELAQDIVMSLLNRTYRSDNYVVPSEKALKMFMTAQAVEFAGDTFRTMSFETSKKEEVDDKLVSLATGGHPSSPDEKGPVFPKDSEKAEPNNEEGQKLYVSYYGSRNIPEDAFIVQISTSAPKGFEVDVRFESTYPDYKTMVAPHKDGKIDDAEYTRRYQEDVLIRNRDRILENVERIKEMAEGRDVYFLCYEKPGAFCHRYLLSNFLNENGISCEELPADRLMYSEGKIPFVNELSAEKEAVLPSPVEEKEPGIVFTESKGGYSLRTYENARADDVDFTLAFAVNFNTPGEVCTARAAGDSLIRIEVPQKKNGGIDMSPAAIKKAVTTIVDSLPDEFLSGEELGLNIAGNGMFTLAAANVNQNQADEFVVRVLSSLQKQGVSIASIRTGGQTGFDEAGLVAGVTMGIPTEAHAPKGWAFRDESRKDTFDEKAFKARFEQKDYRKLRSLTEGSKKSVKNNVKLT